MKGTVPIITCDDEYGCSEWMVDEFALCVTNWKDFLNGWRYDPYNYNDDALCPRCVQSAAERAAEEVAES